MCGIYLWGVKTQKPLTTFVNIESITSPLLHSYNISSQFYNVSMLTLSSKSRMGEVTELFFHSTNSPPFPPWIPSP